MKCQKAPPLKAANGLSQEALRFALRIRLGARPACQHKGDLVHKIGNVVGHVEILGCSGRIVDLTNEVARGVNGPSQAHNDAHVVEGCLDMLVALTRGVRRLSREDLEEDEGPTAQAQDETPM